MSTAPKLKLFRRLRLAVHPPSSRTPSCCSSRSGPSDPELSVPASPKFPDADRFTPRNAVEMFGSEYSAARDLGMRLAPSNNTMSEFDKRMNSEKAKRFVKTKVSRGVLVKKGDVERKGK
mmetsp:Transcript_13674/g.36424  ORF Transcript_13674/g.36424 Transcript_13674/m.36424 type:complete len:120 (-) Transcript_13674:147-506(-)